MDVMLIWSYLRIIVIDVALAGDNAGAPGMAPASRPSWGGLGGGPWT